MGCNGTDRHLSSPLSISACKPLALPISVLSTNTIGKNQPTSPHLESVAFAPVMAVRGSGECTLVLIPLSSGLVFFTGPAQQRRCHNTTTVLLGTSTPITQSAMRELAKVGVLVGFCGGGGGTPLFSASEVDVEVAWLRTQSEYQLKEYLQYWVRFWFDDARRLDAAKAFQLARLERIHPHWFHGKLLREAGFSVDASTLESALDQSRQAIIKAVPDNTHLLKEEARFSKLLFKLSARATGYGDFTRGQRGSGGGLANRFLDQGNYLAYGLAASATWVLGLPDGLAVLHGKTRRGGLVFDVADLVKDAIILPQAFIFTMTSRRPTDPQ
jgi:CRISPR-associated protein Cas1